MTDYKHGNWRREASLEDVERRLADFFKDLSLFISLLIARLMVRRTLWQRRRVLRAEKRPQASVSPHVRDGVSDSGDSSRSRSKERLTQNGFVDTSAKDSVQFGYLK
jgi:hypothetical protein